ncbi:DUF6468 domain-containing protein [Thioclava sp. FR2]|uniref:DUF6468 domain-containing protein n=1 Tax=Thioclava sp. FR2 TaxID=3445780 RepID=UPI003EB85399
MTLIADFLVAAGGFAAAFYCYLLSRRLKRFTTLESGMGSAIAVLSAQVDDMTAALARAKTSAERSEGSLETQVRRAEAAAARLEIMLASMHDIQTQPLPQDPEFDDERRVRFVRRRFDRQAQRVAE